MWIFLKTNLFDTRLKKLAAKVCCRFCVTNHNNLHTN